MHYQNILYFTFLFSLFVFISAAGQYNVIWSGTGLRSFGPYNIFLVTGPVHILPYDPQFHELFAIYIIIFSLWK